MPAVYLFQVNQFFDQNGNPLNGGKLNWYSAGTTTPLSTYTDSTGTVVASNPVLCDSAGRAQIWLTAAAYKLVIQTSAGVTLQTIDGINVSLPISTLAGITDTGDLTLSQATAATGSANQSSNNVKIQGRYWTGAADATDTWNLQDVVGTGANPTSTLQVTHAGSSGVAQISVPGTTNLVTLNSKNFESIRFADQFATGSTTGGIQEAINDLPSNGGTVILPAGTTACTAGITIQKPVRLIGHGCGGSTDAGTNATYVAGTVLANNTTGTNLLTISLAGGATSLVGVTLENFAIQGNKSFAGATTGDCITISGGGSTTQIIHTTLRNLTLHDAKSNGISIKENVYGLNIEDCWISKCAGHGIAVSNSGTGIPSQIRLARVFSWLHTGDALNMNGTNVHDVSAVQCTFANSTNGVNVVVGSTVATFIGADRCNFESNSNAGVLLSDGFGHCIRDSQFQGDSVQLYGVYANFPVGAGTALVQLALDNNNLSSHVTNDIKINSAKVVIIHPQAANNYSYSDVSGNAARVDVITIGGLKFTGSNGLSPTTNGTGEVGDPAAAWGSMSSFSYGVNELTAPAGAASRDILYGDSTKHRLMMNNNNTGWVMVLGADGAISQKSEIAADAALLSFTPPAAAGTYRLSFVLSLSLANTATLGWTATWTDSNGAAQTPTNLALFQTGTAAPALTFATSAAGNYHGEAIIDVNNSATAIVVKLTFAGTSFTGKASATIERLI